jgi:hypothetical protein
MAEVPEINKQNQYQHLFGFPYLPVLLCMTGSSVWHEVSLNLGARSCYLPCPANTGSYAASTAFCKALGSMITKATRGDALTDTRSRR